MAYKRTYKRTPKKTSNEPSEADEQSLLFEWLEYAAIAHPELELAYHIVNEGRRSQYMGHKLREQGMKKGVPDICLPIARGRYNALYIEMKRRNGGRVSKEQKAWIEALNRYGNKAVVCKGFDEAKKEIESYLGL